MSKALTAKTFDRLLEPKPSDRIIWTLAAIGGRIGVGPDFVRDTLAKQPGSPVKEIGGRYYCFESDLLAYLRSGDRLLDGRAIVSSTAFEIARNILKISALLLQRFLREVAFFK